MVSVPTLSGDAKPNYPVDNFTSLADCPFAAAGSRAAEWRIRRDQPAMTGCSCPGQSRCRGWCARGGPCTEHGISVPGDGAAAIRRPDKIGNLGRKKLECCAPVEGARQNQKNIYKWVRGLGRQIPHWIQGFFGVGRCQANSGRVFHTSLVNLC